MTDAERPVTILIAALGGEGGGVLSGWIVAALEAQGLAVQATSIPGVAQRTGATTYYIEAFPVPLAELGGRRPVLSLYPSVGDIDVMVASELIEAGRAIGVGYVTPDRTTLIASTHRVYAIGERAAMADGRFDTERTLAAARERSAATHVADYAACARDAGTTLNAVLLGVVAGSGALPAPAAAFEDAIRATGIAVDNNLAGFRLGLERSGTALESPARPGKRRRETPAGAIEERARAEFPAALHDVVVEAVRRLVDYQGPRYAGLYLDRLERVLEADDAGGDDLSLTRETGRRLAAWMAYEDVIRVAQIKAGPARHRRVLDEVRAGDDEPITVTEFFKPGLEELCSLLPGFVARPILAMAERGGWRDRVHLGLHVKTTTINGYLRVWLLAKLRGWRPRSHGYRETQGLIEAWLDRVRRAAATDRALALEVAGCAALIKGYSDTQRRGRGNFLRVCDDVIEPALTGAIAPEHAADAIANARAAALADVSGARLAEVIAAIADAALPRAAE